MVIKILSTMLVHPGWWAVFTSPSGEPIHMPVAAWATIEYTDDCHDADCPDQEEPFQEVEAMIADGVGLSTVHGHSEKTLDWKHLVGLFGPGQYEKVTSDDWAVRCRERLAWMQANEKADDSDEPVPKVRHLRPVN